MERSITISGHNFPEHDDPTFDRKRRRPVSGARRSFLGAAGQGDSKTDTAGNSAPDQQRRVIGRHRLLALRIGHNCNGLVCFQRNHAAVIVSDLCAPIAPRDYAISGIGRCRLR